MIKLILDARKRVIDAATWLRAPVVRNGLRALTWRVRTALAKHARRNPDLTEAQIREVAAEIAARTV
jgi:hypothetical protein